MQRGNQEGTRDDVSQVAVIGQGAKGGSKTSRKGFKVSWKRTERGSRER